jgi:hypothetical protein
LELILNGGFSPLEGWWSLVVGQIDCYRHPTCLACLRASVA